MSWIDANEYCDLPVGAYMSEDPVFFFACKLFLVFASGYYLNFMEFPVRLSFCFIFSKSFFVIHLCLLIAVVHVVGGTSSMTTW